MGLKLTPFELITGSFAAFASITLLAVAHHSGAVENKLVDALAATDAESNISSRLVWHAWEVDGQQVTLHGAAVSVEAAFQLVDQARAIPGITQVKQQVALVPPLAPCQQQLLQVTAVEPIKFKVGKAEVANASRYVVGRMAEVLRHCDANVEIASHTDSRGSSGANQDISQRRANAVKAALVQLGVDETQVLATGYGERQPLVSNASSEGRDSNSRTEVRLLGGRV